MESAGLSRSWQHEHSQPPLPPPTALLAYPSTVTEHSPATFSAQAPAGLSAPLAVACLSSKAGVVIHHGPVTVCSSAPTTVVTVGQHGAGGGGKNAATVEMGDNSTAAGLLREIPPELMHIPRATTLADKKFVWNSQQDVASLLLAATEHEEWISREVRIRPPNGTMILYRRSVSAQARNLDGYTWKKKYKRKTVRETHMVLKLNGVECIFANYAHSAILPTFHRRAYFLRHNPNIVLFHYLNVPPVTKDDKLCIPMPILSPTDLEILSRDRLMEQLRPMFDNFPTRLTKPDGKQILSFDVASVSHAVAETVMSQLEGRALPVISPDACFVFTLGSQCVSAGRQVVVSCSNSTSSTAPQAPVSLKRPSSSSSASISAFVPTPVTTTTYAMLPGTSSIGGIPTATTTATQVQSSVEVNDQCLTAKHYPASPYFSLSSTINTPITPCVDNSLHPDQDTPKLRSLLLNDFTATPSTANPVSTATNPHPQQQQHQLLSTPQSIGHGNTNNYQFFPSSSIDECLAGVEDLIDSSDPLMSGLVSRTDNPDSGVEDYGLLPDPNHPLLHDIDLMDCLDLDYLSELPRLDTSSNPDATTDSSGVVSACSVVLSGGMPPTTYDPPMILSRHPSLTSCQQQQQDYDQLDALVEIRHCAPEWALTRGGDSMLLAGPWYSSRSPYSCYFGLVEVPAKLVQNGVLSCSLPEHTAGVVQLQVACEGRIISRPRRFEFRQVWPSGNNPALSSYSSSVKAEAPSAAPTITSCPCPSNGGGGMHHQASSSSSSGQGKDDACSEEMNLDHWIAAEECVLKVLLVNKVSRLEQKIMETRIAPLEPAVDVAELQETLPVEMLRDRRWRCRDSLEVVLCRCCAAWCRRALLPINAHSHHRPRAASSSSSNQQPMTSSDQSTANGSSVDSGDCSLPGVCWPWEELSLMSLCGALGYAELLRLLFVWFYLRKHQLQRLCSPECQPETDLETPSVDRHGLSPLMWASIRGHWASARLIARWCPSMLHITEPKTQRAPAQMSELYGHSELGEELRLQEEQLLDGFGAYRPLSGVQYAALWDALSPEMDHLTSAQRWYHSGDPEDEDDSCSRLMGEGDPDNLDAEDLDELLCGHVHSLCAAAGLGGGPTAGFGRLASNATAGVAGSSGCGGYSVSDESQMFCLAGRIIQAMPRRIKFSPGPSAPPSSAQAPPCPSTEDFSTPSLPPSFSTGAPRDRSASHSSFGSVADLLAGCAQFTQQQHAGGCCQGRQGQGHPDDSGISTPYEEYRHPNLDTPSSSVSPSGACGYSSSSGGPTPGGPGTDSLSSPYNFSMDSPPPTTEEIAEHFNAPTTYMEADFSRLTLSDIEQKRLYEAAKVIQKCFRAYKLSKRRVSVPKSGPGTSGVKGSGGGSGCATVGVGVGSVGVGTGGVEQGGTGRKKEIEAAITIQSYYRRYKQYAYYKRMCHAAVLIQNQYRWYVEQKKSASGPGSSTGSTGGERLKRNKQSPVMVNQRFRNHYQRKLDTDGGTAKSLSNALNSLDRPSLVQLSGNAGLFGQSILPQRGGIACGINSSTCHHPCHQGHAASGHLVRPPLQQPFISSPLASKSQHSMASSPASIASCCPNSNTFIPLPPPYSS